MTYDRDTGEFIPPLKTYLDEIEIYDEELGGLVPAWKSLVYWGAKAKRLVQQRNDSAAAISEAAQKGGSSSEPKRAPPLVADADEGDDPVQQRILDAISSLEARLDRFEQRKAEEAERRDRAEKALLLAEEICESAPETMLDALPPASPRRLH